MNSVHEPGSRTMSKNFDSGKYQVEPGQKQAECTECTAQGQPARPGREPSAHPALPRALRARPRLSLRPVARAPRAYPSSACRARHACLCPRACQRPRSCRPPATRAPAPTCALSRAPTHAQPSAPAPACAPSTPACARPARPTPSLALSLLLKWAVAHQTFCTYFFFFFSL